MFAEILPNILAPIMVEFTVRLGYAVFTIVSLSFLGFGLQPPNPNWGSDISANFGLVDGRVLVGDVCSTRSPSPRWSSGST